MHPSSVKHLLTRAEHLGLAGAAQLLPHETRRTKLNSARNRRQYAVTTLKRVLLHRNISPDFSEETLPLYLATRRADTRWPPPGWLCQRLRHSPRWTPLPQPRSLRAVAG